MTRYTPLWLQAGSYPAAGDRRLISAIWPAATVSGCAVTVQANMNLNVGVGWVVVPTANNTGSVLCASDSIEVVTLGTAPGAGTNRIDVVACTVTSTDIGTTAGDAFSFTAIAGTPAASPVAPTVPAGSVAIAQVLVIGGQATVQAGNITDRRALGGADAHTEVYQSAVQSIPNAAQTAVVYDTVEGGAGWDNTNRRFVCPTAGRYLVTADIMFNTTVMLYGFADVYRNGAEYRRGFAAQNNGVQNPGLSVAAVARCSAGDTLSIAAFFTSTGGVALNTFPGSAYTFAAFTYLGAP